MQCAQESMKFFGDFFTMLQYPCLNYVLLWVGSGCPTFL